MRGFCLCVCYEEKKPTVKFFEIAAAKGVQRTVWEHECCLPQVHSEFETGQTSVNIPQLCMNSSVFDSFANHLTASLF